MSNSPPPDKEDAMQLTVVGAVKLVRTVAAIYEAVALPGGQDSGSRRKEGHDELHNRDRQFKADEITVPPSKT